MCVCNYIYFFVHAFPCYNVLCMACLSSFGDILICSVWVFRHPFFLRLVVPSHQQEHGKPLVDPKPNQDLGQFKAPQIQHPHSISFIIQHIQRYFIILAIIAMITRYHKHIKALERMQKSGALYYHSASLSTEGTVAVRCASCLSQFVTWAHVTTWRIAFCSATCSNWR